MICFKFATPHGDALVPFSYEPGFCHERTTGTNRLRIAPASDQISLLRDLSRLVSEPFGVLYVLIVSRVGSEVGRYQCPEQLSRTQIGGVSP